MADGIAQLLPTAYCLLLSAFCLQFPKQHQHTDHDERHSDDALQPFCWNVLAQQSAEQNRQKRNDHKREARAEEDSDLGIGLRRHCDNCELGFVAELGKEKSYKSGAEDFPVHTRESNRAPHSARSVTY